MKKVFELEADSGALASFRKELEALLLETGLPVKGQKDLVLAVSEALANVMRHSYEGKGGRVRIAVEDTEERVEITIRDFGKKFDASKVPPPQIPPEKPGGLGLYMMKKLVDRVQYNPQCPQGNELILIKHKDHRGEA